METNKYININYKVEFFSDWHCGSGLAAGAECDAIVIKDKDNLPFIPGRTIKGLLREAVENIISLRGQNSSVLVNTFGNSSEHNNMQGQSSDSYDTMQKGYMFFTNAELHEAEREYIINKQLQQYLYHSISSTKIDKNGLAEKFSLRTIETCIPCTLYGTIMNVPNKPEFIQLIKEGLHYIKRLGLDRNRGLGRCEFTNYQKV